MHEINAPLPDDRRISGEIESGREQPPLDHERILDNLFEIAGKLGMDLEEDDVEGLRNIVGEDDNDFLGNLASLAIPHSIDIERFFELLDIPLERTVEFGDEMQ